MLARLKANTEQLQKQGETFVHAMERLEDRIDKRFEEVNQRFTEVNQQFTGVNQRLTDMQAEIRDVRSEMRPVKPELHRPPIPPRKIKAPRVVHPPMPRLWRNFKRWSFERRKHMARIEHQSLKYGDLFSDLGRGLIKIPQFQRDFVWSKEQTANLIDSIIKGFPIGTFVFWKTTEELGHVRDIGNVTLEPATGRSDSYILDGQQRIVSLYLVRTIDYRDIAH